MHYTVTTNTTDPLSFTISAHAHPRWTPGWITTNTITFPCVGTPAAPAVSSPESDLNHLVILFLSTADRLADLAVEITRLERQAKAGKIGPQHAARSLRRILGALETSLQTIDITPL